MLSGGATREGTARYRSRFARFDAAGFYRLAADWSVSSLGIGTYLGPADDITDRAYEQALTAAVESGINFLDTAINYRHERSEQAVGAALAGLVRSGSVRRDEVVVCTKAGFLVPGAIPRGLRPEDVAGGMHSMAPAFLADQIDRSRANLGIETIDVFYLHNPETQLNFVSAKEFEARLAAAFELLERCADESRVRYYGTATWGGYRTNPEAAGALSLRRVVQAARQAGGDRHRFRFIQLPYNLAMTEAFTGRTQANSLRRSVLEAACEYGLAVVTSAALLQARLARDLPEALRAAFPDARSNAQCAIQFARSAPGVAVALAGMSRKEHVEENLGVAAFAPLVPEDYHRIFSPQSR